MRGRRSRRPRKGQAKSVAAVFASHRRRSSPRRRARGSVGPVFPIPASRESTSPVGAGRVFSSALASVISLATPVPAGLHQVAVSPVRRAGTSCETCQCSATAPVRAAPGQLNRSGCSLRFCVPRSSLFPSSRGVLSLVSIQSQGADGSLRTSWEAAVTESPRLPRHSDGWSKGTQRTDNPGADDCACRGALATD